MELFATEFSHHPSPPPPDNHDVPPSAVAAAVEDAARLEDQQTHQQAHQQTHQQAPPTLSDAAMSELNVDASDPSYRPKALLQHMTEEEKKERQKQQNRRAAERSRNKKREELTALEMTVFNIQHENQRLRERLATLLSAKPGESSGSNSGTDNNHNSRVEVSSIPTGIDYATLSKLQAELASAKATLLQRELELGKAQGIQQVDNAADDIRATLLTSSTALQSLQSEVKALHSLISHLRRERDDLARQRETLARELEARRLLKEAVNDTPAGNMRAAGVERALLDLRALVDGVIRSWDQSSMLPPRRLDGDESDEAPE